MRVKILKSYSTESATYRAGEVTDMQSYFAFGLIRAGIAQEVAQEAPSAPAAMVKVQPEVRAQRGGRPATARRA